MTPKLSTISFSETLRDGPIGDSLFLSDCLGMTADASGLFLRRMGTALNEMGTVLNHPGTISDSQRETRSVH